MPTAAASESRCAGLDAGFRPDRPTMPRRRGHVFMMVTMRGASGNKSEFTGLSTRDATRVGRNECAKECALCECMYVCTSLHRCARTYAGRNGDRYTAAVCVRRGQNYHKEPIHLLPKTALLWIDSTCCTSTSMCTYNFAGILDPFSDGFGLNLWAIRQRSSKSNPTRVLIGPMSNSRILTRTCKSL